jgi:BirA family biotin operon repressor/biotin-[acetyl-CoA-carboxylase] ligase
VSDPYDLSRIKSALSAAIYAGKVHYFPEIASTNTIAMQAATAGVAEGSVFVANQQTGGRGRNGHIWRSEADTAILVSIVLRPRISTAQSLWLSLMAGVAVHDAISRVCNVECDLRWPNDMLVGKRKVCGILTEISADQESLRFAVIGIGINVHQSSFPPEIADLATSLAIETGRHFSRTELLLALLESLEAEYFRALSKDGTKGLLERVESVSSYVRGRQVHVDEAGGYEGVTDGLDEQGFLRVRTKDGVKRVLSGGVRELAS